MTLHVEIRVNDKAEPIHHVEISNVSHHMTSHRVENQYVWRLDSHSHSSLTGAVTHVPDNGSMVLVSKVIEQLKAKGVGR